MPSAQAFVGLGGNVGNREDTLRAAIDALANIADTRLEAVSRLYETDAVGPSGAPFLNAAVRLSTTLEPRALLDEMLAIERAHGRVRRERWGARTLDLDLLAWVTEGGEALQYETAGLQVPHPRIGDRDFVLAPLADLAPRLVLPGGTVTALLEGIPQGSRTIRAVHSNAWYRPGPQADSSVG